MLDLPRSLPRRLALLGLALFFVAAGLNHFVMTEFYLSIMPPYLPAPLALVYLSGVFEVLGGLAVLLPATRSLAGWGLILLLWAVYPANVHMALHPETYADFLPPAMLYARLPLQFVAMAWSYWATRPELEGGP